MSKRRTRLFLFDPFGPLCVTDPDSGGGGPTPAPTPPAYAPPATQADLDRIIKDRLDRERAKFADYADLKAKAEAHDKALEDAKTEQEKAVDAARKEGEAAANQRANARLVSAEIRALAAAAGFRDPADATAHVDAASVQVGDDGQVDAASLKAALDELAKAKPYLLKETRPRPVLAQGSSGGSESGVAAGRAMFDATRKRAGTQQTA